LLVAQRTANGERVWTLARRSQGQFSTRRLKSIERGAELVDDETAVDLAALYGADLGEILGDRLPIEVTPEGLIRTGGVSERFDPRDPDSLLMAYLVLVRRLRRCERDEVVDLRRKDIEILASELGLHGISVVERLGALMGATRARRTSMAALFGAGVAVIGVATGVAAISTGVGDGAPEPVTPNTVAPPVQEITVAPPSTTPAPFEEPTDDTTVGPVHDAIAAPVVVPAAPVTDEPAPPPAASVPVDQPTPTSPTDVVGPPPVPPTVPVDVVGEPPLPPETSPPPIDTLAPGEPVITDPPPTIIPPDDGS
jgi:hypothetical protein